MDSGKVINRLEGHKGLVNALAFSPDGQRLVSGSDDATAKLWNPRSGYAEHDLWGHGGNVRAVAFSPRGDFLATASEDGTVKLWSPYTGLELRTLQGFGSSLGPSAVAFLSGTGALAVLDASGLLLFDPKTGQRSGKVEVSGWEMAVAPDGELLACNDSEGKINLYALPQGEMLQTLDAHAERVDSLAFSPDGKWLATGGVDRTAKLWQISR